MYVYIENGIFKFKSTCWRYDAILYTIVDCAHWMALVQLYVRQTSAEWKNDMPNRRNEIEDEKKKKKRKEIMKIDRAKSAINGDDSWLRALRLCARCRRYIRNILHTIYTIWIYFIWNTFGVERHKTTVKLNNNKTNPCGVCVCVQ